MPRARVVSLLIAAAVAVCTAAPSARAGDDKAVAEALFRAARDLMAHGKLAEACPKFAESHRIDPKPGTILNLAACHEKEGRTATAWADYTEAAALAGRARQADRERYAKERAAALEPKLSYVTLGFPSEADLEVLLDGQAVSQAASGTRVPLDPGEHLVEARAPGKTSFSGKVVVKDGPSEVAFDIPPLATARVDDTPGLAPAPAPPTTPPARVADATPPAEPTRGGGTQRTLGWITMGAGVVGLGLGGFFGVRTFSEKSTVDAHCNGKACDAEGIDANDRAKTMATISTIGFVAGGVLLAGGAVLVFTAKPSSSAGAGAGVGVGVGITPSGILARGTF